MPVRTALLVSDSFVESDVCLTELDLFDEEEEEDSLHLFSMASSISICSSLHSWLQKGVSPLQTHSITNINKKKSPVIKPTHTHTLKHIYIIQKIQLPVHEDVAVVAEWSAAEEARIKIMGLVLMFTSGVIIRSWAHLRGGVGRWRTLRV